MLKKTFVLFLIFAAFVAGYFYFNKPQAIQFAGVSNLSMVKVTAEAAEIRGDIVFHNPNKMRSQLGKIDFDVSLNGTSIGKITDNFKTAIKGEEDFHYAFQVRFPFAEILKEDTVKKELPLSITGSAGSDVLFANYAIIINNQTTVKNILP